MEHPWSTHGASITLTCSGNSFPISAGAVGEGVDVLSAA